VKGTMTIGQELIVASGKSEGALKQCLNRAATQTSRGACILRG
jgi:hypothetical protein